MKTAITKTIAKQKRQTKVSAPLGVTKRPITLSSSRMGVAAVETETELAQPIQEDIDLTFREHFRF